MLSLLSQSCYRFVLVNNALSPAEAALLMQLAEREPRCRYVDFGVAKSLGHARALNRLYEMSEGSHFAFIDSDVFAFAPFAEQLERLVASCDIVTACLPMFVGEQDTTPGFLGRNVTSPAGQVIGTSYAAVYRRQVIHTIADRYRVRFKSKLGPARLAHLRGILRKYGWEGHTLDTAKLLNILALEEGFSLQHQQLDGLAHIGGMSRQFLRAQGASATEPFCPNERSFPDVASATAPVDEANAILHARRIALARYFAEYLMAKEGDAPLPILRLPESAFKSSVQALETQLNTLHCPPGASQEVRL